MHSDDASLQWDCGDCKARNLCGPRRCGTKPGPPGSFKHVTKKGLSFDRCPKAWLRDSAAWCVSLLADYRWFTQHGVLPMAGGKMDQDPRFIDAVNVLDQVIPREVPWLGR